MKNNKNITIYVTGHDINSIKLAKCDDLYTPLFVGAEGNDTLGFLGDDTGDNISNKNNLYSELTGLYWICKNSKSDIIGLNHYRRYLRKSLFGDILDKKDISGFLNDYDLIVPLKYKHFYSLPNYEALPNSHPNISFYLDLFREIIKEKTPEYLPEFDYVSKNNTTMYLNMFIGSKKLINNYSDWIFPLLFELEKRINLEDCPPRLFGYITETYFEVWILHKNLKVKYLMPKTYGFKLNIWTLFILHEWGGSIIRKFYEMLNKNKYIKSILSSILSKF